MNEGVVVTLVLLSWGTIMAETQFVPGFLVESGTDLQEWPKDLAKIFPNQTSPEEHNDYYANAVSQLFQAGTVAAPLPENNPVEEVLGGQVLPNDQGSPEYPSQQVLPNGTALSRPEVPFPATLGAVGGTGGGAAECGFVAFSVSRANYKHRKAGTQGVQVLFDKVLTSVGPGFNHTGGYFKCVCPGYYHFSVYGVSPLQGRARLDLMRNRQRVASSEAQYYGFGTAANSVIIYIYKNDVVYVYLAEGFIYENDARFRGYASFTGFKIG
ncbi:Complement C1q-like protein 4-like [Homarus americanus]|uniref:Complement C1q-like protein 4-like n=1 Tax=Homarus americanus TaxID=6706 RepID=A0A8J5JCZ0_HOMAM|nr:Complement C1q-like protein 4-like [Homarus americanus]